MECPSAELAWVPLNHNPALNNIFEFQKPLPKWKRFFISLIFASASISLSREGNHRHYESKTHTHQSFYPQHNQQA